MIRGKRGFIITIKISGKPKSTIQKGKFDADKEKDKGITVVFAKKRDRQMIYYRGDTRPPSEIFATGFKPINIPKEPWWHQAVKCDQALCPYGYDRAEAFQELQEACKGLNYCPRSNWGLGGKTF